MSSSSRKASPLIGQTVESEFVPTRPFRVNAGAAHSYILKADGTTSYLCELKMGDEVMVVNKEGLSRSATVGRVKIERRPFVLFRWKNEKHNEAGALLQQAETVRLISESQKLVSITELEPGTMLLGWAGGAGRHVGQEISADVKEN